MEGYYSARAREYEAVYFRDDEVRQLELTQIRNTMRELFRGKAVLEVACGTGYWTQFLAQVARRVVAIDASWDVLAIAKEKRLAPDTVIFSHGDAYQLNAVPGNFTGSVANFWLSHVPRAHIQEFLHHWTSRLGPGATVFMADNVYNAGVGGELVTKKGSDNTYKIRPLADGRTYEVLKNYYGMDELRSLLAPYADDLQIHVGTCYWSSCFIVK